jgi:AraC-like DNA-binding protein
MDEASGGPVVVAANWYRFRAAEHIRHDRVESVCLIWVLDGVGTVTSGGTSTRMTSGTVLLLPWGHDVEYRADDRAPFRLGTVHVVPWHDHAVPVRPVVAHMPDDPLFGVPERRPVDVGPLRTVPAASDLGRRTATLGRYTIERFDEGAFDESVFRALGALFLAEVSAPHDDDAPRLPAALERMTAFVADHLDRPLAVAEVAEVGGCSASTAERLFARHLGSAVSSWIREVRMREAATLLRTSGLRVGEVGRAVGFADQLYFSRVFRATFGVPPSRFAADRIRP